MTTFEASNGVEITFDTGEYIEYATPGEDGYAEGLDAEVVEALREFFRSEKDEELGRWRWPENPDYVVYPATVKSRVRVLRESGMGDLEWVDRGDDRPYEFCHAARAYFEAHPERKPWHDAEPWETWVFTIDGKEQSATIDEDREFRDRSFRTCSWMHVKDDRITAARRIWPEKGES